MDDARRFLPLTPQQFHILLALASGDRHGYGIILDVAERTIGMPSASLSMPFDLPDYARWRLLEGLDDIGVTLRHADAITEFERRRPGWLPASGPRAHATT